MRIVLTCMYCLALAGFVISFDTYGQTLTKEQHDAKLSQLNDREKVEYIIKNNYALYSADFDHALKLSEEAIKISQHNHWKDNEAQALGAQGVVLYLKGNFEKALPSYLRAYSIFDSLKHLDGLSGICNELAVFYRKQKDTKSAYHYLDLSEQFAIQAGNKANLGTSYAHRAVLLDGENKLDEAYKLYQKVYAIRLGQNDSVGLGYALLDLSSMVLRKGDLKKALEYIKQSTTIRKKIGDEQGVAVNLVNTGETYYSVREYRKAIDYFEQCLTVAIKIGYTDLIRYAYEQLAASHVQLNDYKNAFVFQQKSEAFNDSLFNIEKTKVIADLQTKYETEKKEQQIVLQQATLAERESEIRQTYIVIVGLLLTVALIIVIFFLARSRYRRQQQLLMQEKEIAIREAYMLASIQSQENERKRFAQDLHDGMGQLISALRLSLLSVNRNSTLEHRVAVVTKAEGLLNDMHREIRSIAFNLMPQTLVQHGLVPALREMGDRINSSSSITIHVKSFEVPSRLTEVQEISLYRVIQEWINNVIKYSTAVVIEVQLVGHEQELSITIEDNGYGFDIHELENSAGNGWKNIRSRINLLKGAVDIDSHPGRKGTTLIIRIPLTKLKTSRPIVTTTEQ